MSVSEERATELRAEGARGERHAILALVESHLRLHAHGHGADGAAVLEHLMAELEERERRAGEGPVAG
jgi:hypothetical protein